MSRIFINPSELELNEESVISINRVSKATNGGRRMRFNSLVCVGDGNGHVGIGFGKANDVAMAVSKAKEKAKKRIIKVPIMNGTVPHRMDIKHGSVRLMLKPAGPGTGIIAVGPVREILTQLGIKNILSKNKYGKYLAIGGFAFFFIKGLIWLAVIFSVGFSAFNFI